MEGAVQVVEELLQLELRESPRGYRLPSANGSRVRVVHWDDPEAGDG